MNATLQSQEDRRETIENLRDIIDDIRVAMLTTHDVAGAMHARPMWTAKTEFDGDLWFFTDQAKVMVDEIKNDPTVNVSYCCPVSKRYATLSGKAEVIRDRRKIESLWEPEYAEWFPANLESEDLSLLKITVDRAHYWDHHQKKVYEWIDSVKSFVTGQNQSSAAEGRIDWSKEEESKQAEQAGRSQKNDAATPSAKPDSNGPVSPRETILAGKELTEREKGNL